jgi:hypothetical protein
MVPAISKDFMPAAYAAARGENHDGIQHESGQVITFYESQVLIKKAVCSEGRRECRGNRCRATSTFSTTKYVQEMMHEIHSFRVDAMQVRTTARVVTFLHRLQWTSQNGSNYPAVVNIKTKNVVGHANNPSVRYYEVTWNEWLAAWCHICAKIFLPRCMPCPPLQMARESYFELCQLQTVRPWIGS